MSESFKTGIFIMFGAIAIILLTAALVFGTTTPAQATPAPEPARHYDAENGVMCYTIPGDISCVKAD